MCGDIAGENRHAQPTTHQTRARRPGSAAGHPGTGRGRPGDRHRRHRGGKVKCEQPVAVVRLQCDGVIDAVIGSIQRFLRQVVGLHARAPGAAIEMPEDRAAPVTLVGRRQRTAEFGAEGGFIRQDQFADAARRHAFGQAAHGIGGVAGRAPERA